MMAVLDTDVTAVRFLLQQPGIMLNERDALGRTALMCAAHVSVSYKYAYLLSKAGADVNIR